MCDNLIREEYKLEMQMLIMILYFKLAAPICIIIAPVHVEKTHLRFKKQKMLQV